MKRYLVMGDEATAITELRADWQRNQIPGRASSGPTVPHVESIAADGWTPEPQVKLSLRRLKDETEVNAITRALEETRWNRKRTAQLLNISYRGLLYKIRKHGITRTIRKRNVDPPGFQNRTEDCLTETFRGKSRI